jgi:DNA repair exonuclease SbcCD ATPase subunit
MVKIVQISDIHWRGLTRHEEYRKAFSKLYAELKQKNPDIIINTGDTFHTKTQGITPEIILELSNMFNELADIAPTYTLLGNHDGNLTNVNRLDVISPIHKLIKNPDAMALKESGAYALDWLSPKIALHAYSVFDKTSWGSIKPLEGYVNIALYHGSVTGCEMDNEWRMTETEQNVGFFEKFDFALLGDIHKHQYLGLRKDINGADKPWIGYPGSLIQQNYGEEIKKGYLVWDIRGPNDWDVDWHQLINMAPYVTIPWLNSVEKTIESYKDKHKEYSFMPGTRFRITSSVIIPQVHSRRLIKTLTEDHGAAEVVFKTDTISRIDSIKTDGMKISKKSLAQDPNAIFSLYRKYLDKHSDIYGFTEEEIQESNVLIGDYLHKLSKNSEMVDARDVNWSIKELKFDNLFGYGEGNYINFNNLSNIVGILGPNRAGKSSIVGAIMYVLFNASDRGSLKNSHIINRLKNSCYGMMRFSVGNEDYVVERRSEKSNKKNSDASTTSVNLWKIRDDGCQEIKVSENGISRDDTDAKIRKLIGTAEDFLLTGFASQGNLNRFIDNKATKRKEILNRFLELDIFEKLFNIAKEDYSKLNNRSESYSIENLVYDIDKTQKEVEKISSEISSNHEKKDSYSEKRDKLNLWISSHQKDAKSIDASSYEKLQQHVSDVQKSTEELSGKIVANKTKLKEEKTKHKALLSAFAKIKVEKVQAKLSDMSEVEKSLLDLKSTFEIEKAELKTQENSVFKLTMVPCGDKFPSCHFIKDGHAAKATIAKQNSLVLKLEKEIEKSKKHYEKYLKLELKETLQRREKIQTEIAVAATNIANLEEKIVSGAQHVASLKKDFKSSSAKLKQIEKTINTMESEEFSKKQESLQKHVEGIKETTNQINELLVSLGGKKEKLDKLLEEKNQGKDLIKKMNLLDSIQQAFSKNGIPAMILMTQLPAINLEMSKIIGNLVDFSVTLETDTDLNIMDIYIEDGKSKRIIELGSGMEKTICSLALRVALGNLSSLSRPDILILDEAFGALDEDSLQKGMELLSLFRNYFKSIFVITHIAQVKEATDRIIEIKNDGIESIVFVS